VDAILLDALRQGVEAEGAVLKLIAPKIGGVLDSGGKHHPADEKIGGGPSVLFDAVALLPGADGAAALADDPAARDFLADAFAHCKIVGHGAAADPLIAAAGLTNKLDAGFHSLPDADAVRKFLEASRKLRFWDREAALGG
jgi:catalase